jgi:hypothetical protein
MGEKGDGVGAAESALWAVAAAVDGGFVVAWWWAGEIEKFKS